MRDFSEIAWWRETRRLALTIGVALIVIALLPALVSGHDGDRFTLGMQFGTLVGTVVAPLAALGAALAFTVRQRAIDRRHDVADD